MARKVITIDNILGGLSPSQFFGSAGQYHASIGIDPDFPIDDSAIQTSGLLRPTAFAKFSGATVTGVPLWILTNPKDSTTYIHANDGKVHTVDSTLAMGADITAPTSSSGGGAAYYDNYLYFRKNTDVARYGPLNGAAGITQSYWQTTLGKTALIDTTYPSIRGIETPNGVMYRHTDNKLYFLDVVGNQGVLHFIKTTKTTVEGDTNDGSTYNALDFPYGLWPTTVCGYGTDIAVALIEGSNTTIKQSRAKVSFWDTTSSSYQKIIDVEFPDPLITAMKNVNGILYVWSGNASGGVRLSRFIGGYTFEEAWYNEEGVPPLQGAVDAEMNKVIWGAYTTYPEASASIYSFGSKKRALGNGIHNVFKSTSAGANGMVTALKFIEHANNSKLRPIIGWSDDSAKGLDKISTTYATNVWRSAVFRVGQPFVIKEVHIPLAQAIAANMTLIPKIFVDEGSSSTALKTINNTNLADSERNYKVTPDVNGKHNFFLELRWSGTVLLTVSLPIIIVIETVTTISE